MVILTTLPYLFGLKQADGLRTGLEGVKTLWLYVVCIETTRSAKRTLIAAIVSSILN